MARSDNDSDDELKVRKKLSELKKAYENLLKYSKLLITHFSNLKQKNEELMLQLSKKDKTIQKLSGKEKLRSF